MDDGFKRVNTISLFEAGLYLADPGEREELDSFDRFGEGCVYVIEGRELGILFDFLGWFHAPFRSRWPCR